MNVIAFNGSPRKNGATATLLHKALEGAASQGAKTEFVQLSQLAMKGCQACFSCKTRGGKSYGKCIQEDGMTPLYDKMEHADAVFLGTPIYFGTVSSGTTMFIERLFPYFTYKDYTSLFPKKIRVGLICTLGAGEQEEKVFRPHLQFNQMILSMLLGPAELLVSTDTLHVEDYSTIVADALVARLPQKLEHHRTVFPADCEKAFAMGAGFARGWRHLIKQGAPQGQAPVPALPHHPRRRRPVPGGSFSRSLSSRRRGAGIHRGAVSSSCHGEEPVQQAVTWPSQGGGGHAS